MHQRYERIISELRGLIEELETQQPVVRQATSDSMAPDEIAIDVTSLDMNDCYIASVPGNYLNCDTVYVRRDLMKCDYYEAYLAECLKTEKLKEHLRDIRDNRIRAKNDFSPIDDRNMEASIREAFEILGMKYND